MKLKKRIVEIAIAAICCVNIFAIINISLIAKAESNEVYMQYGDYLYYTQVDENKDGTSDYAIIKYCDESAVEIVIPNEIDGSPVKEIEYSAFSNCINLKSIEIPDSVTSIGDYAFCYCTSLASIEIPDSVIKIGESAFLDTALLENQTGIKYADTWVVEFDCVAWVAEYGRTAPVEIKKGTRGIADRAFDFALNLEIIDIPDSVVSIGRTAFSRCFILESITIRNPDCIIYDDGDTIFNYEDPENSYYYNGVIYGYENSTAQKYADKYGRKFALIGKTGDADGNGKTDIIDAAFIAKRVAQRKVNLLPEWVDYNNDGKVNIADAAAIARDVARRILR